MKHLHMDESTNMAEDDGWLEAEIQKELDAINSSELDVHYDDEEPPLEGDDDLTSEDESMPPSILEYLTKVKVQSEKVQQELDECDTVLEETSLVCHRKHLEFDEDLQQIAQEEGIDVQTLKEKVIIELDKEDLEDEKLAATYNGNNVNNSSEQLPNQEASQDPHNLSADIVSEHVSSNAETEKTNEPKKRENIDLNETDIISWTNFKQTTESLDAQNTDRDNCQSTDSVIAENADSTKPENTDSSDGSITDFSNKQNTDVIKETVSEVVTDAGDAGSNHGDAGSNHGDAGSNHGDKSTMEDKSGIKENAENSENETEEAVPLLPDQGAVVRVVGSDVLEKQLVLQVTEFDQRRRTNDKLRQQVQTERRQEEEFHIKEIEHMREQKRQEYLEEEQRLIQQRETSEAEVRKQVEEIEKQKEDIQESFKQQQCQIDQLIEETRAERDQLQQSVKEQSSKQELKKQSAATKIQATFRRFQARMLYGAAVEEKIEAVRMTMEAEKVRMVEQQIEARKTEDDKKKKKEDEEKKELERKKQEETKVKEELEQKKKEEKERKKKEEKEKRKLEEEERKHAEEEKKLVEKQRKQEEKLKKMEEAKKKKEEEKKKKEEEKKKKEEEKKKKEEEKKRYEEEKKRKEAIAQQKKEEAARKLEETRKEEKLVRLQEEELRTQKQDEKIPDDEMMDTVETKDEEETQQQHETEDGRQTQNAELQQKEAEETKTQEEEEKDKQDKEQLRPEDGEKKRLEEESKRKEQDLRQVKDNETNNEGKDMEENEEDNVQKGEGNYKGEGNVDVDRKQSAQAVQDFEHPPQTLQDFEQSPKTVQESKHSVKTTKDSEQPGQIIQDVEQRNVKKNTTCDGRRSTDSAKVSGRNTTKLSSSCVMNARKDWGDYLPEPIDNKRLAWIKDCLPWSKIAGVLNMRQGRGSSKRPPRRPASANTLPPLTEVRLLSATGATSLQKITTVQLQDLPGCSLSTLSYCGHLKALALNNCGLVTVEGLEPCTELTYLDLQNNKIEMISPLKASVGLTYVNLSHNCLSMIHGLEECTNIRYLDLSHNRITRIGGLGDLRRLHTLWLCHNQLISSHGIGELVALQNVDLSHNLLPRLDDMQHLALLQVLNAASNNLLQVPQLSNHVLLQQFLLHDNSISSIRNIAQGWRPLLQHLDLSKNSVSFLADLASCMLLETFDLKDNQVSDLPSLLTALSTTRTIETLDLTGCPVCQEANYRTVMSQVLPTLCTLDGTTVSPCWKRPDRTEFEEMCLSQIQQESSLRNSQQAALEQCTSVIEKSQVHKRYFDRSFQLAVKHRQSHEYGEVTVDPSTTFDLNPTAVQPKKVVSQTADMKALFDEAVRKTTQESSMPNVPRPPSGGRPKELASRPQSHILVEKTMSTPVDSCKKYFTREAKAAVKIQALWRGHNLRRKIDYYTRMSAAMSIQACWRGYYLRKRLHQAMDYARFGDDDSESVYGEVNMDDFDFSEADLDKGWTPPETPQLPQNHAVLRPPPSSNPTPVPAVPPLFMHRPFPPDQPKQAWRNADSPFSQTGYHPGARVSLAPLSAPSETCMTQRTALSKKEEQITEEWGFKDGRTAELMLQRAKKLKYNVAKRKKLSKLDPQQRLAMMRKLEQPQPLQPPTRRAVPRTEYFKGRVQVEEKRAKQEFAEKRHRMFEWLHTQVGNFDITSSRINKHLNTGSQDKTESSHNLPQLDPGVIAGGKAQFMGSPRSLEMQSLCEGASGETPQPPTAQRRLSMQDDYSRGRLPQIKTTSAPVMRVKEKMSWRNKNNARTSGGWGGGRKRTKPS